MRRKARVWSELVEDIAGGTRSGRPIRAVQIGGPLGAYLPTEMLDLKLDYETLYFADAALLFSW